MHHLTCSTTSLDAGLTLHALAQRSSHAGVSCCTSSTAAWFVHLDCNHCDLFIRVDPCREGKHRPSWRWPIRTPQMYTFTMHEGAAVSLWPPSSLTGCLFRPCSSTAAMTLSSPLIAKVASAPFCVLSPLLSFVYLPQVQSLAGVNTIEPE